MKRVPDHATIARFRVRHREALAELFGQVLGLCVEAELVRAGVIAVDGSKFGAAASDAAIRSYEEIAAEVLTEAERIDAAEDERYGAARGDELPEHLSTRGGARRAWLRDATRRIEAERATEPAPVPRDGERRTTSSRPTTTGWRPPRPDRRPRRFRGAAAPSSDTFRDTLTGKEKRVATGVFGLAAG